MQSTYVRGRVLHSASLNSLTDSHSLTSVLTVFGANALSPPPPKKKPKMDGFAFSGVADAPLPDEILLILAVSGARRPFERIGAGAPNDFLVPKPA